MRRQLLRGALALAILTAASTVPVAAGTSAADCWLLDDAALERAQAAGRCGDVFARSAPARVVPKAKPQPPRKGKAKTTRRARAKPAREPGFTTAVERFFAKLKPAEAVGRRTRNGSIDHLTYGRTDRNPVHR